MNFILSIVLSAVAVLILVLIPWVGVGALNLSGFFGVFLPYVALIVFFVGLVYRAGFQRPQVSSGACPGSSTVASTTPRARSGC
jgi:hypothetical protein